MTDALTHAIVDAATHIPEQLVNAAAAAVQNQPGWSAAARTALTTAIPAANYREHTEQISHAWSLTPAVTGAVVGSALRTATATAATVRSHHDVSLVWTGPATAVADLRSTRSVLAELVTHATRSLVLVSFATHDIGELTGDLAAASARGVEITLILETPDEPGAPLTFDPNHPFKPLRAAACFYRWPQEQRKALFSATARLHAKCVIADRSSALITSANLTSAGINDNLELGVLIQAGPLPETLSRHLELLIEEGTLERA